MRRQFREQRGLEEPRCCGGREMTLAVTCLSAFRHLLTFRLSLHENLFLSLTGPRACFPPGKVAPLALLTVVIYTLPASILSSLLRHSPFPTAGSLVLCFEGFAVQARERGRAWGGARERARERERTMVAGTEDTSMTKVFVGGLAWETQKESLKEHFDRYGEIQEAVIIFDKATGRSKGYGFVTFKEAEAAKKACEEATPIINGRRANCNLASLGARRIRLSSTAPAGGGAVSQAQQGLAAQKSRSITPPPPPANTAVPLYYPYAGAPFQQIYPGLPYYVSYGYAPSYLPDVGYNTKLSYPGGGGAFAGYLPVQFPAADPDQAGLLAPRGGAPLPCYPWYQWQQQQQAVGAATHPIATAAPTAVRNVPAVVISKPPPPRPVTVEQVAGCR